MIVRVHVRYLITTIKSEVWPICHCLGLGHETMLCGSVISSHSLLDDDKVAMLGSKFIQVSERGPIV